MGKKKINNKKGSQHYIVNISNTIVSVRNSNTSTFMRSFYANVLEVDYDIISGIMRGENTSANGVFEV